MEGVEEAPNFSSPSDSPISLHLCLELQPIAAPITPVGRPLYRDLQGSDRHIPPLGVQQLALAWGPPQLFCPLKDDLPALKAHQHH